MGCLEREKSAISGKTGIARCLSLFLRLILRRARQYSTKALITPDMMLTLPGGREAPGIDSRVRMMVVWCNHLLTRLPDHDDVPAC